ncbi:hypothetical protein Cfor_04482, partial [Coptotermes formosanus]
ENTLDANGNQVPEAASVLPPGDPGSQQQVYETQSSHEYFVKEEDGKVVEEQSASSKHETISGNMEPPETQQPLQEAEPSKEGEEAVVNGSRATEIHQESIKSTLKEIISEIEEAVVSEVISDSSAGTNKVTQIAQELNQVLGNLNTAAPGQQNGEDPITNGDSTQEKQMSSIFVSALRTWKKIFPLKKTEPEIKTRITDEHLGTVLGIAGPIFLQILGGMLTASTKNIHRSHLKGKRAIQVRS